MVPERPKSCRVSLKVVSTKSTIALPHVLSRVDPTGSFEVMSRVLFSLRKNLSRTCSSLGKFIKRIVFMESARKKTDDRSAGTILVSTHGTKIANSYPVMLFGHVLIHGACN